MLENRVFGQAGGGSDPIKIYKENVILIFTHDICFFSYIIFYGSSHTCYNKYTKDSDR